MSDSKQRNGLRTAHIDSEGPRDRAVLEAEAAFVALGIFLTFKTYTRQTDCGLEATCRSRVSTT